VVYKVGNMAETNFKIDISWLTTKTCLLPHPWGDVGVKFHEFVMTQLLGEIGKLILGSKDAEDTSFY